MGLSEDEMAFYNTLEVNDTAVQVLGDDQLGMIAREIAEKVKANATIWLDNKGKCKGKAESSGEKNFKEIRLCFG